MSRRPGFVASCGVVLILSGVPTTLGCRTARSMSAYAEEHASQLAPVAGAEPIRTPEVLSPKADNALPDSVLAAGASAATAFAATVPAATELPLAAEVAPTALSPQLSDAAWQRTTAVVGNELLAHTPVASMPEVNEAGPQHASRHIDANPNAVSNPVQLVVKNVRAGQGRLKVAVFTTPENFPEGERADTSLTLDAAQATVHTSLMVSGRAAIAVYQDLNSDGQLNRNRLGMPSEPFAFSNSARGKRGPPAFDQAALEFGPDTESILIELP